MGPIDLIGPNELVGMIDLIGTHDLVGPIDLIGPNDLVGPRDLIGPNELVCPSDHIAPNDLGFRLGCPYSSSRKICLSESMIRLFARNLISEESY